MSSGNLCYTLFPGIFAFGSLITDPEPELQPNIALRIKVKTPFPVEYARISRTRGGAPTLVPHECGAPVLAEVLAPEPMQQPLSCAFEPLSKQPRLDDSESGSPMSVGASNI